MLMHNDGNGYNFTVVERLFVARVYYALEVSRTYTYIIFGHFNIQTISSWHYQCILIPRCCRLHFAVL